MKKIEPILIYLLAAGIFLSAIFFTDAHYWGDTPEYVDSVIAFENGRNHNFWEFGHVLWRPVGWFVWRVFYDSQDLSTSRIDIIRSFQALSYLSGLGSTLLLFGIMKRLKLPTFIILFSILCFVFSHAFLNYTQTGSSYVTALFFYILSLYLSICYKDRDPNLAISVVSGVFLGISFSFWIAFLWSIPAAILATLILNGFNRKEIKIVLARSIGFTLTVVLLFGIVLTILQINTFQGLSEWITVSAHDDETTGLMRPFFGLARSFVDMGKEGLIFKRFLLGDPYNHVSFLDLVRGSLLKLAAFYLAASAIVVLLWLDERKRRFLLVLLLAVIPVFVFATQHGGGEIEWHVAHASVVFIGFGLALDSKRGYFIKLFLALTAFLFCVVNAFEMSGAVQAEKQRVISARVNVLKGKIENSDRVFLVNWADDLVQFHRNYSLDSNRADGNLKYNVLVTPGTGQTRQWREEFAVRCIHIWKTGGSVWVSTRAFAGEPKSNWNWAEGDDKKVRWPDFPEFFNGLAVGDNDGAIDGFVLLLPNEQNRLLLEEFAAKFEGQVIF